MRTFFIPYVYHSHYCKYCSVHENTEQSMYTVQYMYLLGVPVLLIENGLQKLQEIEFNAGICVLFIKLIVQLQHACYMHV